MTLLEYAALVLIILFMGGLLYVDAAARLLLASLASEDVPDTAVRSAAEGALDRGFQARLRCLKSVQPSLHSDASASARMTLRIYSFCLVALTVLFPIWAAAMLIPEL